MAFPYSTHIVLIYLGRNQVLFPLFTILNLRSTFWKWSYPNTLLHRQNRGLYRPSETCERNFRCLGWLYDVFKIITTRNQPMFLFGKYRHWCDMFSGCQECFFWLGFRQIFNYFHHEFGYFGFWLRCPATMNYYCTCTMNTSVHVRAWCGSLKFVVELRSYRELWLGTRGGSLKRSSSVMKWSIRKEYFGLISSTRNESKEAVFSSSWVGSDTPAAPLFFRRWLEVILVSLFNTCTSPNRCAWSMDCLRAVRVY